MEARMFVEDSSSAKTMAEFQGRLLATEQEALELAVREA
jgi:hypothetical protein